MLPAAVPAIKRGKTWPNPKALSNKIPSKGLPFCAIQPNRTANTGVVHGEDARPNAKPAAIGAIGVGTFSFQIVGSGPFGSGTLKIPIKLRPISIAKIDTNVGKNKGI